MNLSPEQVKALVQEVVMRTLGDEANKTTLHTNPSTAKKPLLTAEFVRQLPTNSTYEVDTNALITPLARQVAMERHIQLSTSPIPNTSTMLSTSLQSLTPSPRSIAIGADHGGYALKEELKAMLETAAFGYTIVDCGTYSTESVDYPDYAYAVAQLVANGRCQYGIMIDGAGIGSCMAANKVPGVRAAMCYDQATAVNSKEHNNANVLTLGAGLIGTALAKQIVTTWLNTEFGGGRHARRVNKIDDIGKRFNK